MTVIWSGHISFGLVSVPVQLLAAVQDARAPLHEVHSCGSRIRHRRVCEREQVEVPQHEIHRGWEAPDGRMVVLDAADLDALPLPSKRTIDVLGFVPDDDVDPVLYDRPYWVAAHGEAAQRPYALLVEALARHGVIGVCKVALRARERLAVLRPRRGVLVCHTLRWPEEVRDPGDLTSSAPVTDRELRLAEVLMEELAGVDLAELHDDYAAALDQLVTAKMAGRELEAAPEPEGVVDLMAALEASIRRAGRE
jgi:DNA end-binding protein Ku